jgi:hypothetical protein
MASPRYECERSPKSDSFTLDGVEYARRCTLCGTWDAKSRWASRDEAESATDFSCEACTEYPGNYEIGVLEEPYSGAPLLEALGGADLILGWVPSAPEATNGELLTRLKDAGFDVWIYPCGQNAFTVVVWREGEQIFAEMDDWPAGAFVKAYEALVGSAD